MTHRRSCLFECFSCYGKIDRYYVEFSAKRALQKSPPLPVLGHPEMLVSLTPCSSRTSYSWFFLVLQPFLLCSLELPFRCKHLLFYPPVSWQNVSFTSWLWDLSLSQSLSCHCTFSLYLGTVSVVTFHCLFPNLSFPCSGKTCSFEACCLTQPLLAFHHCRDLLAPGNSFTDDFSLPL